MEAAAALQDLALRWAPAAERESRLETLRGLQAGRKAEIRCAHNGPYLVTNPERIRSWLGEEIRPTPQMAADTQPKGPATERDGGCRSARPYCLIRSSHFSCSVALSEPAQTIGSMRNAG